jgi:hypothetical protein
MNNNIFFELYISNMQIQICMCEVSLLMDLCSLFKNNMKINDIQRYSKK